MDLLEARRRKFSVGECRRMAEAGVLSEGERVDLVDGGVVEAGPVVRKLFDVGDYYRLLGAGVLHEDDRVELIEGEIIQMAPIGGRHAACVDRLNRLLSPLVGDAAIVRVQSPVRLSERVEPQPDLTLLRPRDDFYAQGHPTPSDVLLLVEVAETSLRYDREVKLPLYARTGIPEVWIVDLQDEEILAHSRPEGDAYNEVGRTSRNGSVTPCMLPGLSLRVDDVLG